MKWKVTSRKTKFRQQNYVHKGNFLKISWSLSIKLNLWATNQYKCNFLNFHLICYWVLQLKGPLNTQGLHFQTSVCTMAWARLGTWQLNVSLSAAMSQYKWFLWLVDAMQGGWPIFPGTLCYPEMWLNYCSPCWINWAHHQRFSKPHQMWSQHGLQPQMRVLNSGKR